MLQVWYFHSNPPPYGNRFPVSFRNAVYFENEKSIELQFLRQHFSLPLPAPPLKYKSRWKSCGAVKQAGLIITIGLHKRMGGVGRRGEVDQVSQEFRNLWGGFDVGQQALAI